MADENATTRRSSLLVLRAQAGDRAAIDRLIELHQVELLSYLAKMLRNHSDAEDALQTTLIQVVRKLRWLRNPKLFRPWMYRIASRVAFRIINRREKSQTFYDAELVDEIADESVGASELSELVEQIPDWLDLLTPKGREAVMLHYLNGFTSQEVAEILNVPLATAKSRISYSLACIRKRIVLTKGK